MLPGDRVRGDERDAYLLPLSPCDTELPEEEGDIDVLDVMSDIPELRCEPQESVLGKPVL